MQSLFRVASVASLRDEFFSHGRCTPSAAYREPTCPSLHDVVFSVVATPYLNSSTSALDKVVVGLYCPHAPVAFYSMLSFHSMLSDENVDPRRADELHRG